MDLAYAAADLVLCRSGAMTVRRAVGRRAARGVRAAAASATASSGSTRCRVVEAGGGLLVDDADLTPGVDRRARCVPLLADPRRAGADAPRHAAAAGVPATPTSGWPTMVARGWRGGERRRRRRLDAARCPTLDELGRGALRRHRRGRDERHRPDPAARGVRGLRQRPPRLRRPCWRCGRSAPGSRSATTPAHLGGRRHRRRLDRDPRRQPRAGRGPRARACGCCRGPRRWPR